MLASPVFLYRLGKVSLIVMNSKASALVEKIPPILTDPALSAPFSFIDRIGIVPVVELDEAFAEDFSRILQAARERATFT